MVNIYELLTSLPLFNGASYNSVSELVAKTKLHFLKYAKDDTVINAGDSCDSISFVISGAVRSTIEGDCFSVSQTLKAPDVLSPEFLFGKAPFSPCTVTAVEPAGIMKISKIDYLRLLESDKVFMLNFLNVLSMNAQKTVKVAVDGTGYSARHSIARLIISLTKQGGEDISLACTQGELHSVFGVSPVELTKALDAMTACGILEYSSRGIKVLSRRALLDILIQ